jgi:hypothetical protein
MGRTSCGQPWRDWKFVSGSGIRDCAKRAQLWQLWTAIFPALAIEEDRPGFLCHSDCISAGHGGRLQDVVEAICESDPPWEGMF